VIEHLPDDLALAPEMSLAVTPLRFPVTDLVLRASARLGAVSHERLTTAYEVSSALARLRASRSRCRATA
jgi:hypothetical protein